MTTSNHPFLEFPQIKPPLLMMGKTIKWKPNTIEVAPSCPRCFSSNTKFCYYNNYSVSQPRYFCKACRRYWTKGGSLRNVPIGGGCRKSRRTRAARQESPPQPPAAETANGLESGVAAASAKRDDRNVVKDYECSNFAPSSAISECGETVGVIDGGDEQVQRVHGCFDGRDFVCGNFGVFEVDGIDFGSEMLCSNLEGFGCEQPPLMEMQEFEVFATDNDDDRLLRMSDENLITDNWASFDPSAYDNF